MSRDLLQEFEENFKAKKEAKKRKPGRPAGGPESGNEETSATPPPAKRLQMHPQEEVRPRGFDRGLQAEKVLILHQHLLQLEGISVMFYPLTWLFGPQPRLSYMK